jgi:HAMP domain-containing protein
MWIVIAAVVLGLIILVAVTVPVIGRLSALRRAVRRLQGRQQEALKLQAGAAELERTLTGLQRRAETTQERLALIRAGHDGTGKHAFPARH